MSKFKVGDLIAIYHKRFYDSDGYREISAVHSIRDDQLEGVKWITALIDKDFMEFRPKNCSLINKYFYKKGIIEFRNEADKLKDTLWAMHYSIEKALENR